ncbi:glycosyl hydrolase family 28-related protein [Paenibacillus sp. D2_2]|uniref:glycosyl hydrolase family 28-related protein n=1 Tax=Paenibacillus sp. D2_2 TaxID=3073092 RepID=UPI002814A090|nr:glycosyl hydrolase family 28-related protein [Paenibacillus sp. D2_2]WMT39580.1 glycosyl hydrolase family 28-related protein [Paenibacillus sp. D2_2]
MFKYEVVEEAPEDGYFYVLAQMGGKTAAINFNGSGTMLWTSADSAEVATRGNDKVARMTFVTGESVDGILKWGIRKGGSIVVDDISVTKGKAVIPAEDSISIGYVNVTDYGAVPGDGLDDTVAFQQAIATGKSVFVPAGVYHVQDTLQIQNQNLVGAGMFVTQIVASNPGVKAPVLKAGRTSVVADLGLSFQADLITDREAAGERVGIYTSAQWSLQRGSTIRNVRISDVGTAIYSPNGAESFSVTYDTLEIENFSYRGIDFSSDIRTGNVFNNIYLKSSRPHVDVPFALTGEESEVSITQLNVEHTKVNTAILLEGVYGLAASTIHIEGVTLRNPNSGYITLDGSTGSIESLSVYYSPIEQQRVSLIQLGDSTYDIGNSFKPETAATAAFLRVGTLHVKGLNDPNADLHGAKAGGLNQSDASGFVFFDRPQTAVGKYTVQLDNYVWYTFQDDQAVYRALPVDPDQRIIFTKLGVVPSWGNTKERPVERLIPWTSMYYDTDLQALLIWNGGQWKPVINQ